MDLNTISAIVPLETRAGTSAWKPGSAWLAGGTWLFSEPQPSLDTLLDLSRLTWPPLVASEAGLQIAATCTLAELNAYMPAPGATALDLIPLCCNALLGSFKIWNMATVGGNICLALPAAPMIALTVALEGVAVIWMPDGGERSIPIVEFVRGSQETALEPGELLRAIDLPARMFSRRAVLRKASLTALGRSAALLIGTRDRDCFGLTITASTRRPIRLDFSRPPTPEQLADAIGNAVPPTLYHDDVHGRPSWRRHLTFVLAEEIRAELFEE